MSWALCSLEHDSSCLFSLLVRKGEGRSSILLCKPCGIDASDSPKDCAARETRATWIVEIEEPPSHFTGGKQSRNWPFQIIHDRCVGVDANTTKSEGDAHGDGIRNKRRRIDPGGPVGFLWS